LLLPLSEVSVIRQEEDASTLFAELLMEALSARELTEELAGAGFDYAKESIEGEEQPSASPALALADVRGDPFAVIRRRGRAFAEFELTLVLRGSVRGTPVAVAVEAWDEQQTDAEDLAVSLAARTQKGAAQLRGRKRELEAKTKRILAPRLLAIVQSIIHQYQQ